MILIKARPTKIIQKETHKKKEKTEIEKKSLK